MSSTETPQHTRAAEDAVPRRGFHGIPRFLVILLGVAALWILMTGINAQRDILAPVFFTANLIIVAYPVQHRLNRLGVPRIIGAIVSGLIVMAILIGFFGSLAWAVMMFVQEIPQYQDRFTVLYDQLLTQLRSFGVSETQLLEQLQRQFSPSNIVTLVQGALSQLTGVAAILVVLVTVIFVSLIDSMSLDARGRVLRRTKPALASALLDFTQGVRRYWVVSTLFGVIVALFDVAVLIYLGVPLPWVWGLLAFLTNYIPNVGFVLGVIPPAIMALVANDPLTALIVVVAYSVINFVIQSIIQPKFTGESVGVTATVSFISLLFWSWALGPLGAILALPATLLFKTLLVDTDPQLRWINVLFASDPEGGEPLAGQVDPAVRDSDDGPDSPVEAARDEDPHREAHPPGVTAPGSETAEGAEPGHRATNDLPVREEPAGAEGDGSRIGASAADRPRD